MKLAPVHRSLLTRGGVHARIVHTGQHYDPLMSDVFFGELGIPEPAVHLGVGSGSHGAQTARVLESYETHLLARIADATVVFGDVNSTVACALAAVKLHVPIVHVEAGLRSFDREMPEEINRVLTDAVSDLLLVTESSAIANLRREGIPMRKIRHVGNVMIDTAAHHIEAARAKETAARLGIGDAGYGLVTMHRPSNVDSPETLERLLRLFRELAQQLPLVFPVHPRTRRAAQEAGLAHLLEGDVGGLLAIEPLSYEDNLSLLVGATLVLTDSGGIQEETSWLNVPCLTLRANTERPVTLELGTNRLVGNDSARIRQAFGEILAGSWPSGRPIPLWDGNAAERVADEIVAWLDARRASTGRSA